MNILITGVSGFIGSSILSVLSADNNYSITAIYRNEKKLNLKFSNVKYIKADLVNVLPKINCDILIHVAGLASDKSTQEELYMNNVFATKNILDSVLNCKKVIFISSSSVYNFEKHTLAQEPDVTINEFQSDYGRSKYQAEELILSSSIAQKFILRPRAVYGNGDTTLLPRILNLYKFGRCILPGNKVVSTSLTHIDNLINAIILCIQNGSNSSPIYNIADSVEYKLHQCIIDICKVKFGVDKVYNIPTTFILKLIKIAKFLRMKTDFSEQSLNYFNFDSRLGSAV